MDSNQSDMNSLDAPIGAGDDLSAIAWVHEELRKSLDSAHKALRRFIKDSEAVSGSDIDSVDPGVLRTARAQFHQGVGALELVGLPAAAIVLRASEGAVLRAIAKPKSLTPALVGHIEKLSFGLLDFLTRLLNGKPVSPLSLFPQYRAVQEGVEAERVHPADLWSVDWRWRDVQGDPDAVAQAPDAGAQSTIETQLLALMRGTQPFDAAGRMSDLSSNLGAGAADPEVRTFWRLAAGVFEAQRLGLLGFDVFSKRVASRLLAQFRILRRGDSDVSERLARDLLFFCAQSHAPSIGQHAPRLSHVRLAYGLTANTATDYSASALGRFDPAIVQHAKKRVAAAKEAWSATAGGEMHRLAGLTEQFTLVGDSLKKLFPHGELFATALQNAVSQTQAANAAPPAPIAMEVATSLLYIDAALDDFDFDNPDHALRIKRLAERLEAVCRNEPPQPLEVWMEELYRHVSDRQTMGSVVQELRASLSEVEKSIDAFFRKPADHGVLSEVSPQLASMRGVLSVLGMEQAAHAVARMREEIDGLVETEVDPAKIEQAGVFDRLAGNLSALGFLIDMLSVQPQVAKSLFAFDAETGILAPVMGRKSGGVASPDVPSTPTLAAPIEQRLIEQAQMLAFSSMREDVPLQDVARDLERLSHEAQAADQPGLAAAVLKAQEALERAQLPDDVTSARGDLSEALVDFVATAAEPAGYSVATEPAPLAPSRSIMAIGDLEHDDEMREVFLEEAREVVTDAQKACTDLSSAPDDIALATTVRRAFHTLKGSSRMVGLNVFGEAAWVCEQVYNSHMADLRAIEAPLLEFTEYALGYLSSWVEEIAANRALTHDESHIKLAATRLARRADGAGKSKLSTFDTPTSAPVPAPAANGPALPVAPAVPDGAPSQDMAFELDLSGLDNVPDAPVSTLSVHGALDTSASAMFDPFQSTSIEETVTSPRSFVDTSVSTETLDLDLGEGQPDSMIESLSPSANIPSMFPGQPNLLLDLSSGEALEPASRHGDFGDTGTGVDILTASGALDGLPSDEHVKVVGNLRIGIPLFNIYLNEADELSRRLTTELAEWAMELHRPVGESPIALAHSLAGSSATVGFTALSHLARTLEHALQRSQDIGHGTDEEARLFVHAAEEIRRLLHQFAAGFLREPSADLLERLSNHERTSAMRLEAITAAAELRGGAPESDSTAAPLLDLMALDTTGPSTIVDLSLHGSRADATPVTEVEGGIAESESTGSAVAPPGLPFAAYEADPNAPDFGISEIDGGPAVNEGPVIVDGPSEPVPIDDLDANAKADAEAEAAADEANRHVFSPEIRAIGGTGSALDKPRSAPDLPAAPSLVTAANDVHANDEQQEDSPLSSFGGLHDPLDALVLSELKPLGAAPSDLERMSVPEHETAGEDDDIDAVDAVDLELFPIFEEEALELLPKLASQLRDWVGAPQQAMHPAACMRTLHTLKGGARLAGAMRLGEMAHRLESRIEKLAPEPAIDVAEVEALEAYGDTMQQAFEVLRNRDAQAYANAQTAVPAEPVSVLPAADPASTSASTTSPVDAPSQDTLPMPIGEGAANEDLVDDTQLSTLVAPFPIDAGVDDEVGVGRPMPVNDESSNATTADTAGLATTRKPGAELPAIDWSRFASTSAATVKSTDRQQTAAQSAVRVRAPVLDRLVNQAGEVSITRSRIESGVTQIKTSLGDLTENLERLRGQLRDIELQGEVQMTSRLEAAKAASQTFDPLEFDRFTRFQELTRMMAESVNDVATVQRTLQRSLESAEDELVAQARLTRELQDDLLRTRMIEFEGLSDRLYRVVRLTAKELGKQVRLDIVGGSIEVDRGVLDRMTASFEHLLRNCITHGIEKPDVRSAAGKDATGTVVVSLTQEGNEVGVEFRDDGAGLDLPRIREKAITSGLLDPNAQVDDASLANFIFTAGFSTAETVTELAGRGVGMDVVRNDVIAIGGRIETGTEAGKGTSFKLILPLTTAVTQVVMLRCGDNTVAVPSTLVELVRRATPAEVDEAYANGVYAFGDRPLPFFWLGALLQMSARPQESTARSRTVVLIRSAQQRIAIHVDEVLGNQEVVVKNLGPQLSRLPGLAGITLLASGAAALIYNPVALATLYGDAARASTRAAFTAQPKDIAALLRAPDAPPVAPLVLVVDDSLTVRRVTQRMLVREGYRVTLAKDGLDALERLAEEVPTVVLSDIEMPRMDGFDLVRNIRADARLRHLPVIMITSRIAQKHRDHAVELGVDHYLGKPYSEEDLLSLVGRYTRDATDEATTLQ